MLKIVIFVLACVLGISCQIPIPGACPEIASVQQNFNLSRYLGKWYKMQKYYTIYEIADKCNTAEYTLNDDGTVHVQNQGINEKTGESSIFVATGRFAGKTDEAKLIVEAPSSLLKIEAPYWVLETDYDNYSVVWSCVELPVFSTRFAWVLTRERTPSDDILEKALAVFDKFGLSKALLDKTDQTGCPEA